MSLQYALTSVIADSVDTATPGALKRNLRQARAYVSSKRTRKAVPPPTPSLLIPIESLIDGSAFVKNNHAQRQCCKRQCYERWTAEELVQCRGELSRYGPGSQMARLSFDRGRIADSPSGEQGKRLFAGPGNYRHEVCTVFFRKLYGIGVSTIPRAATAGDPSM